MKQMRIEELVVEEFKLVVEEEEEEEEESYKKSKKTKTKLFKTNAKAETSRILRV